MQNTSKPRFYHTLVLLVILLILATPVVATALYALATEWSVSLWPKGFTMDWLLTLWTDTRFMIALRNSLLVCIAAIILAIALTLPVLFCVHCFYPKLKPWVNVLVMLPFAIPPVVSSVGLLQLYSGGVLPITGTPWILIGCYFSIALPFIYRALDNNMQAIRLKDMMEAGHLLGASTVKTLFFVVLPNLKKGMLVSFFISFSFLIGEFVFANILVGGRFETLQVYLYSLKNMSGHYSSALVLSYFAVIWLITAFVGMADKKLGK